MPHLLTSHMPESKDESVLKYSPQGHAELINWQS